MAWLVLGWLIAAFAIRIFFPFGIAYFILALLPGILIVFSVSPWRSSLRAPGVHPEEERRVSSRVSRVHPLLTAIALLVLAGSFAKVLDYDVGTHIEMLPGDRDALMVAYVGTRLIALLLILAALPFALASAWPSGQGLRLLRRGGLGAVGFAMLIGSLILVGGLLELDQYDDPPRAILLEGHILGLCILIPSSLAILASYYAFRPK